MSRSFVALRVDLDEDLLPLCSLLRQHGVPHRVYEQDGRQVLEAGSRDHARQIAALYRAWRAGEVKIEAAGEIPKLRRRGAVSWRRAPVTLGLVGLSICGFLLVYLRAPLEWLALLTFSPFHIVQGQPVFDDLQGQYWRLVTPAFIHFGWLHIVFNSLWLWELGTRVEQVMGRINMVLLFLVIAVVSNTSQYLFGGPGIFGGMSGVVYGLLGFAWVAPLLQPNWQIQPARSIMIFMVGWLVLCMVGLVKVLGFGAIANAAHLGGLLCGCLLGVLFGMASRLSEQR